MLRALCVFVMVATWATPGRADPVLIVEGGNVDPDAKAKVFLEGLRAKFKERGVRTYVREGISPEEAELLVEEARQAFVDGEGDRALGVLEKVIRRLFEPPAKLEDADELRPHLFKALVLASLVSQRLDKKRLARDYMQRVEGDFPQTKIPRKWFGSSPISFRKKVSREMARAKLAALNLVATPGFSAVFVNGRRAGIGARVIRLQPGKHLVFATAGDVVGELREVDLTKGGGDVQLLVPQGKALAAMLESRGVDEVVLISVWDNRLVQGAFYREGILVRRARVDLRADDVRSRLFVSELVDERDGRTVDGLLSYDREGAVVAPRPSAGSSLGDDLGMGAMVVGGAGVLVGGVLLGLGAATEQDDISKVGLLTGLGGAVLFGTGATLRWVF